MISKFLFFAVVLFCGTVHADDFDNLGGNTVLLEKAKALEPEQNVSIVQPRTVTRRHRLEPSIELAGAFGGESYVNTRTVGINAHYHFNPRFSLGLKYNYAFNNLTPEGEAQVDQAIADYQADPETPDKGFPEIDYVKSETLALVNWYPIYGKLNLFEKRVVHFDLYALAGGGQMQLRSGSSSTYTAGGGIGFWLTPHLTTRLEMRYQTYTAKSITGSRDMDVTVGGLQMGWML